MDVVIVSAAVGSGIVAGVWFAFSGFVMAAFDRLPAAQAEDVMRAINVTALRPPLMIAMFGTAALCVAAAIGGEPRAIAAAAVYLIGCVGVTIAGNVPLNEALMRGDVEWRDFRGPWTTWNSVRGVATVAAAALLTTVAA